MKFSNVFVKKQIASRYLTKYNCQYLLFELSYFLFKMPIIS